MQFHKNKSKKGGLQNKCKKCQKAYDSLYYQKHKGKFSEYNRRHRKEIKDYLDRLKSYSSCLNCPEDHIATLEFHHRDPRKKDISVALAAAQGWSLERVKKEVEKCNILCANCHRKLHYKKKGL